MNGKAIQRKRVAKLLGIFIEESLKHRQTVNHIVWKLAPLAHCFRYATKLLPTNWMKKLYNAHVLPHLIYALPVWGSDREVAYLKPLIKLHKRFIRLVKNVQARAHTKPLMEELDILNLRNLYTWRVCVEMHPYIHALPGYPPEGPRRPQHVHHYTTTADTHRHATRRAEAGNMHLASSCEHYTQKYAKIWNKLDLGLRKISKLKEFKCVLKASLMARQSSGQP